MQTGSSMLQRWMGQSLIWTKVVLGLLLLVSIAAAADLASGNSISSDPALGLPTEEEEEEREEEDVGDLDAVGVGEENAGVDPASWSDYLNSLFDPVFDPTVPINVSAVEGQTAHLVCRVNNLGTKTVSWIRHLDTHILTVGSFTYTSDHRFSALHREGTNEWTLQIRQPTVRDSGLYECQVSTKPIRGYLITLNVVVPTARILHAPELHTDEGGALNLTCVVSPSPAPPEYIFWYHGGEVINYETDGSVEVDVRQGDGITVSTLLVAKATLGHSGRYQCAPSNTDRASIMVHVFKAEEPAAMHTSGASGSKFLRRQPSTCAPLSLVLLLLARYFLSSRAFVT